MDARSSRNVKGSGYFFLYTATKILTPMIKLRIAKTKAMSSANVMYIGNTLLPVTFPEGQEVNRLPIGSRNIYIIPQYFS
jgi:hypothetical protein